MGLVYAIKFYICVTELIYVRRFFTLLEIPIKGELKRIYLCFSQE